MTKPDEKVLVDKDKRKLNEKKAGWMKKTRAESK